MTQTRLPPITRAHAHPDTHARDTMLLDRTSRSPYTQGTIWETRHEPFRQL